MILARAAASAAFALILAQTAAAERISVSANRTQPLRLNAEIGSVVVGNPEVADVTVHDKHLIFVTGLGFGSTNLLVYNVQGRQVYSAELVVQAGESNFVTLNRGQEQVIFDCSPECHPTVDIEN